MGVHSCAVGIGVVPRTERHDAKPRDGGWQRTALGHVSRGQQLRLLLVGQRAVTHGVRGRHADLGFTLHYRAWGRAVSHPQKQRSRIAHARGAFGYPSLSSLYGCHRIDGGVGCPSRWTWRRFIFPDYSISLTPACRIGVYASDARRSWCGARARASRRCPAGPSSRARRCARRAARRPS